MASLTKRVDYWLLLATALIASLGLLAIFSTDVSASGDFVGTNSLKQAIWLVFGLLILLLFSFFNYRYLQHFSLWLFGFSLLVLLLLLFFGEERNGARSWLGLNIFNINLGIQPSEFSKIAFTVFLASFFDNFAERRNSLFFFMLSVLISALPITLIILQGDLGSAVVFLPIHFFMALAVGVPWIYLAFLLLTGMLFVSFLMLFIWAPYSTGLFWQMAHIATNPLLFWLTLAALLLLLFIALTAWLLANLSGFKVAVYLLVIFIFAWLGAYLINIFLRGYMRGRFLAFIAPELYPLSSGWNVIQSVRAIGSGGLWGNGFMEGILARYGYLPQQSQSTDFLFAVLAEEFGFIGCLLLLFGFFVLFWRLVIITLSAPDRFSALFASGIMGMFFFHFVENIGMNLGLMPVMGIPLPLFSYGGSSLMSSLWALGVILNIYSSR